MTYCEQEMTRLLIEQQTTKIYKKNDNWMACEEDEFVGWLQETSQPFHHIMSVEQCKVELFVEDKWLTIKSCLKIEARSIEDHKRELWDVLNRHSLAFALSKGDLDYCTTCEHELDTQGFYPCKSPKKLSEYDEEEVHKHIISLYPLGKMRPIKPKYATKVTLLSKKDGSRRFCGDYCIYYEGH